MPASIGRNFEDLRLVVLALELISRDAPDLPDSLRIYLSRILHEAATLAANPHSLNPASSPEAISLAVELFGSKDLLASVNNAENAYKITPELAATFLERMDRRDAHSG